MHAISPRRTSLVRRLAAAQQRGDAEEAQALTEELRLLHVELGARRVGTREEQTTYLMARVTRISLPELTAVGLDTNTWPPPANLPVPTEVETASPDTERRITDLFHAAGPLSGRREETERYTVEFRPEDNEHHRGVLQPWAFMDREAGIPVFYSDDREWAEYQADRANDRLADRRRGRKAS
jgi:hypothetical protein